MFLPGNSCAIDDGDLAVVDLMRLHDRIGQIVSPACRKGYNADSYVVS